MTGSRRGFLKRLAIITFPLVLPERALASVLKGRMPHEIIQIARPPGVWVIPVGAGQRFTSLVEAQVATAELERLCYKTYKKRPDIIFDCKAAVENEMLTYSIACTLKCRDYPKGIAVAEGDAIWYSNGDPPPPAPPPDLSWDWEDEDEE